MMNRGLGRQREWASSLSQTSRAKKQAMPTESSVVLKEERQPPSKREPSNKIKKSSFDEPTNQAWKRPIGGTLAQKKIN